MLVGWWSAFCSLMGLPTRCPTCGEWFVTSRKDLYGYCSTECMAQPGFQTATVIMDREGVSDAGERVNTDKSRDEVDLLEGGDGF